MVPTSENNIEKRTRSDGKSYSVRHDRHRYFFPNEWIQFTKKLSNDRHIAFFSTLINTGARAMEALNLRPENFDFDRETVTFTVVKHRAVRKNVHASGTSRTFFVPKKYAAYIKRYIKENKINVGEYLFMDTSKLPANYNTLDNTEKRKHYFNSEVAYYKLLKNKLKEAGILDWQNFSLHNLRKTYGMWMRTMGVPDGELFYRLGHDAKTYRDHYGSALIFTQQERIMIMQILGEVK